MSEWAAGFCLDIGDASSNAIDVHRPETLLKVGVVSQRFLRTEAINFQ